MFSYLARVFLFFIAISVVQSVIQAIRRGGWRGTNARTQRNQESTSSDTAKQEGPSGSTLLHQDPVCGTYVAAASSLRKIVSGKVYHFCSDACRDRFNG
jgi:YHS domain-containing protein